MNQNGVKNKKTNRIDRAIMLCSIYDVIKDGNKCIAVDLEGNEFAELNNCHANDKTKEY